MGAVQESQTTSGPLLAERLPIVRSEIERQQQDHWQHWQEHAQQMRYDSNRHAIQHALRQRKSPDHGDTMPCWA